MKARPTRNLLLVGGTLFAVFAAWYAIIIRPQQVRIETLQGHVQTVVRQVQAARAQIQQLSALRQQLTLLQDSLRVLEQRLFDRRRVPEMLRTLVDMGERYHLRFDAVVPEYENLLEEQTSDGSPLLILPFEMRLNGEFLQFGRYIEQLETLPFLVSLESVEMAVTPESYPLVEITLRGRLYLRRQMLDRVKG